MPAAQKMPEIVDVNSDGSKDYFFATGSDMGIIYYDVVSEKFIRTNSFDFEISWPNEEDIEKAVLFKEEISSLGSEPLPTEHSIDIKQKDLTTEAKGALGEQKGSTTERKGLYNDFQKPRCSTAEFDCFLQPNLPCLAPF